MTNPEVEKLIRENENLKAQIQKMKNCINCKHHSRCFPLGVRINHTCGNKKLEWEMRV